MGLLLLKSEKQAVLEWCVWCWHPSQPKRRTFCKSMGYCPPWLISTWLLMCEVPPIVMNIQCATECNYMQALCLDK